MNGTTLAMRRIQWTVLTFLNVASGLLYSSTPQWQGYWFITLSTSIALVPMLYRDQPARGLKASVAMLLATLVALLGLAQIFFG